MPKAWWEGRGVEFPIGYLAAGWYDDGGEKRGANGRAGAERAEKPPMVNLGYLAANPKQ